MSELYWIPLATILLAGAIRGVYSFAQRIYGYSNPFLFGAPENDSNLGLLPTVAVQAGVVMFAEMYLLFTRRPPLEDVTLIPLIAVIIGTSGTVCLAQTLIRSIPTPYLKYTGIVIGNGLMSVFFSLFFTQLSPRYTLSIFAALLSGAIVGMLESLIRSVVLRKFLEEKSINLIPLWMLTLLTGTFGYEGVMMAVFISIPFILLGVLFSHIVPLWTYAIGKIVAWSVTPFCIALRFRAVVCEHCLRWSSPLSSAYTRGSRFCEHCREEVEFAHAPGKVVVTSGDVSLVPAAGRVFVLMDAQHELWEHQQIDVSEIYIDTRSCTPYLLERFVAHLLHTPPKHGIRSVKIFFQGKFETLPKHLQNLLQNNFRHIAPYSPGPRLLETFEKAPVYKTSIKAPALPKKGGAFPEIFRLNIILGMIIGAILGAASFIFIIPSIETYSPTPFIVRFLRWAWLVTAPIAGGQRVKKYQLPSQQLERWLSATIILGLVAAIPKLDPFSGHLRKITTVNMRAIGTALGSYHVDYDRYPATYNVLWPLPELIEEEKFLPSEYYAGRIRDGWEEPYYYVSDGESYTLVSFGKDRKPGGIERFTEDICFVNGTLQDIVKGNLFH